MERRRVRLVGLALVVPVAAVVWWTGRGGGGEERAEVGQTKEPEADAPRERPPEPLAPKPLETVAADVPKPSPRKRVQPLGVGGGTLSVAGRAVDEAGRPVAKPRVEVVVPDGTFADTVGDEDGRFTVPVFLLYGRGPLHGFVEARATDGRLARKEFVVRSDDRFERSSWRQKEEVGDLVLREPLDVDVFVVSPSGGPVAAEVFATSADAKWAVARVVATTGKDGRGRLVGLTPEPHRLVAVASGFGRGTAMWPPVTPGSGDGAPVRINLAAERRIDVTVVDDATKTPLARAEVEVLGLADSSLATGFAYLVPPIAPATSDETGHATLAGLRPDDDVAVTARDETAAKQQDRSRDSYGLTLVARGRSFVVVPRGDTSVTLALAGKRTIEWPIEAGEVPVPADGTPIRIENPAGSGRPSSEIPTEGRVEHGHLVVDGCLTRSFYAEAKSPDGAIARLYAVPEQPVGAPIKFQRGRRVEVILKNADGSPAAGLLVQFQQEGNNPVGAPIKTDADGRAILEGQMGMFRTATLVTEGSPWMGTPLGSATISDGDGRIEVTIPADREAVVRVKADAALNLERVGVLVSGLPATILSRDASRSELRIRWRPLAASGPGVSSEYGTHAGVMAPGFLPADAKIPDGDLPVVDVELHAAASISVTLDPPARASLIMLQRFDASARRWRTIAENDVGGQYRFQITSDGRGSIGQIEPGRYRWYDARSGTVSGEFDAAPGGHAESTLDLTKAAVVRGRVEAPAGESVGGIEIVRLGPDGPLPSGHDVRVQRRPHECEGRVRDSGAGRPARAPDDSARRAGPRARRRRGRGDGPPRRRRAARRPRGDGGPSIRQGAAVGLRRDAGAPIPRRAHRRAGVRDGCEDRGLAASPSRASHSVATRSGSTARRSRRRSCAASTCATAATTSGRPR